MNFQEALKALNIEDFSARIFNSNSRGELFHMYEYIEFAKNMEGKAVSWFRPAFLEIVDWAEKTWHRPESIFQHVFKLLREANLK